MPLSDPLIIVIGVVLIGVIGGAVGKLTGKLMNAASSVLGFVLIVWLASKLLGFDLPVLP